MRILLVGRLPPPPGGVGASIMSILSALSHVRGISVEFLESRSVWRLSKFRVDIAHFNFSVPWRRAIGTIFAWLMGARIVHTVHGNDFEFANFFNRVTLALSDGFILLNSGIYSRFQHYSPKSNSVILTPIVSDSDYDSVSSIDSEIDNWIESQRPRRVVAAYAHSRDFRDGIETYGFHFLAELQPKIHEMGCAMILLDPKGEYLTSDLFPDPCMNVLHLRRSTNFRQLCRSVDAYVRPTSTDGNSVAVLEALSEGTPVVASDVVDRPEGTICYRHGDPDDFLNSLARALSFRKFDAQECQEITSRIDEYIHFYERCLN